MISFLHGQPHIEGESVTILINGVGYGVQVGTASLAHFSQQQDIQAYIHTYVREDQITLYGFKDLKDKKVFLLFLNVSGVGPKTAQTIVDGRADRVIEAIQQAETSFFTAIPRVGKKLAQKIIIELRSKLGEVKSLDLTPTSSQAKQVREALESLGFTEPQIEKAFELIAIDEVDLQTAIKQALALLGTQ